MKILARWAKLNFNFTQGASLQKEEKYQPKYSVKNQAKFEKVVKSTVRPSYICQE